MIGQQVPMRKQRVFSNSFSKRPSAMQVAAYILTILLTTEFYVVSREVKESALVIVFSLSLAALILSSLYTSIKDPTDPVIQEYHKSINFNPSLRKLFYCEDCQSYVQKKSKHCCVCSRCVADFDHHCKWINNCIGYNNYRPFVIMLVSLLAFLSTFIGQAGLQLSLGTWDSDVLKLNLALAVLCIILLLMDLNLLFFHIYFYIRGITTYEWIVEGRLQKIRADEPPKTFLTEQNNNSLSDID